MRKNYIDYLRVAAIIGVITIHVTSSYYLRIKEIDGVIWGLSNLLNSAFRFSVPLFVMISGAVLLGKNVPVVEFYKKRALRILPALVFWNLFFIVFNMMTWMEPSRLVWFLKTGLLSKGCAAPHLWYLSMFACLMMFAPFINQFVNGDKPTLKDYWTLLAVMFVFFLLNGMAMIAKEVFGMMVNWFTVFAWFIAYFIGGYFLDKYGDEIKLKNSHLVLFILVLTAAGAGLNYFAAIRLGIIKDYFVLGNTGPLLFAITMFVFLLARKNARSLKESKVISRLSEASFGMYLIHPVFIYAMSKLIPSSYDLMPLYIPAKIVIIASASFLTILILRKSALIRQVC